MRVPWKRSRLSAGGAVLATVDPAAEVVAGAAMSFLPTAVHAASACGMSLVPISSMQHVCGGVQREPLHVAQPP